MQKIENPSPEQMRAFLEGSQELDFHAEGRAAIYAWVERTLKQQRYTKLSRETKGLVRRFVAKMTGLSRAQLTPYGPKTRSAESQVQPRVASPSETSELEPASVPETPRIKQETPKW